MSKTNTNETAQEDLKTVGLGLTIGLGLAGSLLLSLLSIGQKIILGADPFALKGFLIPALFGMTSGAFIGRYYSKLKLVNHHLKLRIQHLESLNQRISSMEALLPICSSCNKIRIEGGNPDLQHHWQHLETYISSRTTSKFTHGICPECRDKIYPDEDN